MEEENQGLNQLTEVHLENGQKTGGCVIVGILEKLFF